MYSYSSSTCNGALLAAGTRLNSICSNDISVIYSKSLSTEKDLECTSTSHERPRQLGVVVMRVL